MSLGRAFPLGPTAMQNGKIGEASYILLRVQCLCLTMTHSTSSCSCPYHQDVRHFAVELLRYRVVSGHVFMPILSLWTAWHGDPNCWPYFAADCFNSCSELTILFLAVGVALSTFSTFIFLAGRPDPWQPGW